MPLETTISYYQRGEILKQGCVDGYAELRMIDDANMRWKNRDSPISCQV